MRTYLCVMSMHAARSAVFVRTGRVLSITCQATRNFCCWRGFHRHRNLCSFNSLFTGLVPGWFEFSTEWKPFKRLCTRGGGACACLAHGMQCLCVRGACVAHSFKQSVIVVPNRGQNGGTEIFLKPLYCCDEHCLPL